MLGHRARAIVKALKKDKTIKKVPDCIRKPIPDFELKGQQALEIANRKPKYGRAMTNINPLKEDRLFPFLL